MITISNFHHEKLRIKHWQIQEREPWCVLGRNGSGKQFIDHLFTGQLSQFSAESFIVPKPEKVAMVSFEAQQAIYEHELKIDKSDYTDTYDIGTQAKAFLPQEKWSDPLIAEMGLADKLESGYRQLSTGEGRKLLILKAIFSGVTLLICDNPFDSLDKASCLSLANVLKGLSKQGITVVLLLSNRQDIPNWCQKIAFVERGELAVIGSLEHEETKRQLDVLLVSEQKVINWPKTINQLSDYQSPYLVQLKNGHVSYGGKSVFSDLNVTIKPLQHTLITGKNGCGKSTLMQLITGDCTQCYSNDLNVLGYQRGSGESIWQLKQHMGIVSSELHRQYRVNGDLLTVVLSGFYDSIGLYQQPEKYHLDIARQWLDMVGLLALQNKVFQSLSYGEQRLALIARALVKSPYLLILDEPTQGLDELNRHRILNFLTIIAQQKHSTLLLVSHREDEFLPLFTQHIKL
ncbi:ATP-binding cassette domain-containing protein [Thalassotalea castellviae]|uniref:ATP-binding cassette domain-containing protein n=1 Tax=Thalassotalea castellviae TaxID=3075612 RepID=A0ABU3A5I5_9GAMM|nr:ATP-binding cassette domain-containing protein [Thalassotalea sp. W431]MDT0604802.1 ATP-binding cassette domain-containing protein [Thalassotalea sp. W431]